MNFKELHQQDQALLIGNVWDVPSAKTAEKLNFQAIGTSSAAIATLLGYKDGEEMSFSELEYFVKRISLNTTLPLSVDLESGYSREPEKIANHIQALVAHGVVGINIEDSVVDGNRTLLDPVEFSKTLKQVKANLKETDVFINVRVDTFMLLKEDKVSETKKRIQLYEYAGADGIFTPCIEKSADIKEIVSSTHLPLNVMCMPNLPDFKTLNDLGVKRISMGNFLFDQMYNQYGKSINDVVVQNSFKSIF